tara:strand:- start:12316 stop:12834 length:519 start_codon:yes stop_codon:yes gene_type:complete
MSVIIKNIELDDASKIAKWKSDPILAKQIMSSYSVTNVNEAENWIKKNSRDEGQWLKGIYFKNKNSEELLGITRLMFIDNISKNAEFGIYIGESKFQGMGIGKEVLDLTLKSGFIELDLEKIYLKVSESNTKAVNLYLKKNFIIEGCLKEHLYSSNGMKNILCMALFKEDYI